MYIVRASSGRIVLFGHEGAGKSTMIKKLQEFGNDGLNYHNLRLAEHNSDKVPNRFKSPKHRVVYVFDVSPGGVPIKEQLGRYNVFSKTLNKTFIHVANKSDVADGKRLSLLKKSVADVHVVSAATGKGIDDLRDALC